MNAIDRLRYALAPSTWLRTSPPALKAAAGRSLPLVGQWVKATFYDETFYNLNTRGYRLNSAVFACVSALSFGIIEAPLKWYDKEREEILDHPSRALFVTPNDDIGEGEIWLRAMTYAAIGGEGYLYKIRNSQGGVIGLETFHIGNISPVPSPTLIIGDNGRPTRILRYDYDDGTGKKQPIDRRDIVALRWPSVDLSQPWVAMPPLLPALREVATDNEAIRYLKALLQNDAVARMVMYVPADSDLDLDSEEKQNKLKAQWRSKYGGDNRGDLAIVTGGAKVERVSLSLEELDFRATHYIPESRISADLRVPSIIAGLGSGLENSTYSNYGEAKMHFTRGTLSAFWKLWAARIAADSDLNPNGDFVGFDLNKVEALQEDKDAKWARLTAALNAGGITINDFLRGVGLPVALTGGDIRLIDSTKFMVNVDEPKETPIKEIMSYHIQYGVVGRDEVRAGLGLPPEGDNVPLVGLASGATPPMLTDGKGTIVSYKNHLTKDEQTKHDACLLLERDGLIYRYKEDEASIEWRPTPLPKLEAKESDALHTGQWLDLMCPICGNVGVNVFDDHKGLAVCPACTCTFDPSIELRADPAIEEATIGKNGKH